jgi:DNA-binding LacI/PurR family transcriptional regulator
MSPPREERRVRLRDVAARAGVSIGSASQALSRPELVSQEMRARVLAAAKSLEYAGPDPAARRLRLGRAGALGLIFSERLRYQFTDPASPAFLVGLARGMEDSQLGLLLIPDSRFREATASIVREAAVDGFVVYSAVRNDPRVEAALARRVPVVTVDQPRDAPTPFVGIDDRAAARTAAEHVRDLRHERVGVLSFVRALDGEGRLAIDLTAERLAGYEEGLGTAWNESAVRTCRPNATEPARLASLELLLSKPRPTAILAMSDVLALGALQAAAELGVLVPAELSVVGFDDSPAAALAIPALTTVAQPHEEKGRLAATWLIGAIERGSPSPGRRRRALLPTELVVRDSTAPPRRQKPRRRG